VSDRRSTESGQAAPYAKAFLRPVAAGERRRVSDEQILVWLEEDLASEIDVALEDQPARGERRQLKWPEGRGDRRYRR
jgi:hypothetical protein